MIFTYFARGDRAKGKNGNVNFIEPDQQKVVELAFDGPLDPSREIPGEHDRVVEVDGIERHYWLELEGHLRFHTDLSRVKGCDLRGKSIAVITTDDGRRYAFLKDPYLPEEVVAAIPSGHRRTRIAGEMQVVA